MAAICKAKRQSDIQARMLIGARFTVKKLEEEYGITRRTANRDLIDLADAGLDLIFEEQGGVKMWHVPQKSREIRVRYTVRDVMSLFLGRRFFDFLEETTLMDSFNRVYARIEEQLVRAKDLDDARKLSKKVYLVHEGPKKLAKRKSEILDECLSGLIGEKKLRIGYRTSAGEKRSHKVHPYTLVAYKRGLYIVAAVEPKGKEEAKPKEAPRVFALERITAAKWLRNEPFQYPEDFDPESYFEKAMFITRGEPERVVLRFTATTEPFIKIRRFHKTEKLTKLPDGRLEMTMKVPVNFETENWVLSFGKHVEVMAPASFRDKVQDVLREALGQYEVASGLGDKQETP